MFWWSSSFTITQVGMFGKYLNNVPNFVPEGFDAWMANGGGDYIAPSFATSNVPGLPNGHWKGTSDNYTTSSVGNKVALSLLTRTLLDPQLPILPRSPPAVCSTRTLQNTRYRPSSGSGRRPRRACLGDYPNKPKKPNNPSSPH